MSTVFLSAVEDVSLATGVDGDVTIAGKLVTCRLSVQILSSPCGVTCAARRDTERLAVLAGVVFGAASQALTSCRAAFTAENFGPLRVVCAASLDMWLGTAQTPGDVTTPLSIRVTSTSPSTRAKYRNLGRIVGAVIAGAEVIS